MREIKFRAWNMDFPRMIYFGLFEIENGLFGEGDDMWELTDLPIMQFTGLHDKNGKEIYEGDIVQDSSIYRAPFWQYRIAWNDSKAGWLAFPLDDANYGFGLSIEGAKTLEVIGNICEAKKEK
jgi:uncharacterized phage protein (TIGR01671 family)